MKRRLSIATPVLLFMILFGPAAAPAATTAVSLAVSSVVSLPTMTAYCQAPPLKSEIAPNIMMTIDVSGSMGWLAYNYGGAVYSATTLYEGYFDPTRYYVLDTLTSAYTETVPPTQPCVVGACTTWTCSKVNTGSCDAQGTHSCASNRYACCTAWATSGSCNVQTGNYFNFQNMSRLDLVRWAMTGGAPASCTGSQAGNGGYCDPETWADSGNASKVGAVCNNNLFTDPQTGLPVGGCRLLATNGTMVNSRWDRVNAGLAFQFANMPVKPRMGVMFFDGAGIRSSGSIFVGDFTGAASKAYYTYYNLITQVNSQNPGSSTPTGPALWDVFNYFAQKTPQYGGLPAQTGSGDNWKNPMYDCQNGGANCKFIPCSDSFVILLSDGQWNSPSCSIDSVDANGNSADPVVPAYLMHQDFLNTAASVTTKVRATYTVGLFMNGGSGQLAMQNVAMYGSYDRSTNTWPDSLTSYPSATCTPADCGGSGKGSGCTALPPSSIDWNTDGSGVPDTFFSGNNASQIKNSLMAAVLEILTHTNAGTAASVLASREGSGANLFQAVYYPKKAFSNGFVAWAGSLQDLWYYIDPAFANSNMREDGRDVNGVTHDYVLNLLTQNATPNPNQKDYITQFYFDKGLQAAMAMRWTDNNGDASIVGETRLPDIKVDQVANLWEAGQLLWNTYFKDRNVFTSDVAGTSPSNNLMAFSCLAAGNCPSAPTLAPYLNATDSTGALNNDVASVIMQWVLGNDYAFSGTYSPALRMRLATINGVTGVWKLGDIINSTPKVSSWKPLGDYNITYSKYESTYGPPGVDVYQTTPPDSKYYVTSYQYKGRGMAYTGGNDGMLHAFRVGLLQTKWPGQGTYEKARVSNKVCNWTRNMYCTDDSQCWSGNTCTGTVTLGSEAWSFIPKNVLPYLKYLSDPNYCHVYTVDLTPVLFDASIGKGCAPGQGLTNDYDCIRLPQFWRTILIGGMRLGGGCRETTSTCTNCVSTPTNDPANPKKGLGYSSYFALDITDQDNPVLMWEYDGTVKQADGSYVNKLGFSYSGPAVTRVSNFPMGGVDGAAQRNGRWLVTFGSGPTGPIDATNAQFYGRSDQNLTLHTFDLAQGPGVDNSNVTLLDTGIANAFSGSVTGATVDFDHDYSEDVIYVAYTSFNGTDWTNGGVGRLLTNGSVNPANWTWSTVITDTGPVTVAPAPLMDPRTKDIWIFFGTGRYFYDTLKATDDADPPMRRQLIGMKESCLNAAKTGFQSPCPAAPSFGCAQPFSVATCGGLTNVDNITVANNLETTNAAADPNYKGWYINLDPALPVKAPTLFGQRAITNASVDGTGIVYFTTFKPQNDPCYKGGATNIWAVKYDTGGSATGLIKGNAIVQLSTGSIEQIDLSKAFTLRDNRESAGMTGQPPTREGMTVISGGVGASKPLFMKER